MKTTAPFFSIIIPTYNSGKTIEVSLKSIVNQTYASVEIIIIDCLSTDSTLTIAKIAGVKMCENYNRQYGCNFISVMPTNLYGPNDNYDLKNSHVLPALLRKFHEAKLNAAATVEVWGSGTPKREFLHVDDLAKACLHLMETYQGNVSVNIGTGEDLSIKDLALMIKEIVVFEGEIRWNTSKPNGTPRKLLDVSLIHSLGWKHQINLREGITEVYRLVFL